MKVSRETKRVRTSGADTPSTPISRSMYPSRSGRTFAPNAPFGVEEAIPKVVDVLLSQPGKPGLQYLDREGRTVPW